MSPALVVLAVLAAIFGEINPQGQGEPKGENSTHPDEKKINVVERMNVVLFLAQPNGTGQGDEKGLRIIGLKKRATLQACSYKMDDADPLKRFVDEDKKTCDCDGVLKSSLMSLINYSRNSRGMATAIASSTNETLPNAPLLPFSVDTNNEKNYYHYKVDSRGIPDGGGALLDPKLKELDVLDGPAADDEEELPNIEPVEVGGDVRLFHAVPRKKINWPSRRRSAPSPSAFRPEHTQVFQIDTGARKPPEAREIADVPALRRQGKPKTLMELLGLMASIRNSFFNNFLYPEFDPDKRALDEESGVSVNRIGQLQEPSYFELVKRTLRSAQKEGDAGFLMAVIGGSLAEAADPYSNLVQSVKHVDENTDDRDTMIVVTAACPKEKMSTGVEEGEAEAEAAAKTRLPLYAKGLHADVFDGAQNLFDVPRLIKKAMKKNHKGGGGVQDGDEEHQDEELQERQRLQTTKQEADGDAIVGKESMAMAAKKSPREQGGGGGNVIHNEREPDFYQYEQFYEQNHGSKDLITKRQAASGAAGAVAKIAAAAAIFLSPAIAVFG